MGQEGREERRKGRKGEGEKERERKAIREKDQVTWEAKEMGGQGRRWEENRAAEVWETRGRDTCQLARERERRRRDQADLLG